MYSDMHSYYNCMDVIVVIMLVSHSSYQEVVVTALLCMLAIVQLK